jgi:hypothetical protein
MTLRRRDSLSSLVVEAGAQLVPCCDVQREARGAAADMDNLKSPTEVRS